MPMRISPQVLWLEQQVAKRRTKRDAFIEPTDPKFPQQWYLVGEATALWGQDSSCLKPRLGQARGRGTVLSCSSQWDGGSEMFPNGCILRPSPLIPSTIQGQPGEEQALQESSTEKGGVGGEPRGLAGHLVECLKRWGGPVRLSLDGAFLYALA